MEFSIPIPIPTITKLLPNYHCPKKGKKKPHLQNAIQTKPHTRKWVTDLNEEKKQKLKPLIEQLQIGIWVASIMNQEAAVLCEKREPECVCECDQ